MAKSKPKSISPEEAIEFLDNLRQMSADLDAPTVPVSIRVPGNILKAIKLKARADGKKYQSLMIEYLRKALKEN